MPALGERLRQARTRAGRSCRELDRLAGLTEGHTQAIEVGRISSPTLATVASLAQALGVGVTYLVSDESPRVTKHRTSRRRGVAKTASLRGRKGKLDA